VERVEIEPFSHSLMQQSLFSAVREELDAFFELIASLESRLIGSKNALSFDEKLSSDGLTLRQLWVLIKDREELLRWTCIIAEACRGNNGLCGFDPLPFMTSVTRAQGRGASEQAI
jgi:hypothetical protein